MSTTPNGRRPIYCENRRCVSVAIYAYSRIVIKAEIIFDCNGINNLTDEQVVTLFNKVLDKELKNLGVRVAEVRRKHLHIPNALDPEAGVQ